MHRHGDSLVAETVRERFAAAVPASVTYIPLIRFDGRSAIGRNRVTRLGSNPVTSWSVSRNERTAPGFATYS